MPLFKYVGPTSEIYNLKKNVLDSQEENKSTALVKPEWRKISGSIITLTDSDARHPQHAHHHPGGGAKVEVSEPCWSE